MAEREVFGLLATNLSPQELKLHIAAKFKSLVENEYRYPFMNEEFILDLLRKSFVSIETLEAPNVPPNTVFPILSIELESYEGAPFFNQLKSFLERLGEKTVSNMKLFPISYYNPASRTFHFVINVIPFI